jgi:hypothetical protein
MVLTLVRVARRHADVTHVSRLNNIVQRLHRFFNGCIVIKPVALKNIDIVKLEAPERVLDRIEDVFSAETVLIDEPMRIRVLPKLYGVSSRRRDLEP